METLIYRIFISIEDINKVMTLLNLCFCYFAMENFTFKYYLWYFCNFCNLFNLYFNLFMNLFHQSAKEKKRYTTVVDLKI